MIPALIVLSGFIIAPMFGLAPVQSMALGIGAGVVAILIERWRPRQKPTYLDSVGRPQPLTKTKLIAIAVTLLAIGLFGLFIGQSVAQRAPDQTVAFYFAGAAISMGIGLMLSARRVIETHNAWLASMSPKLDGE